jgi:hypothetical protein
MAGLDSVHGGSLRRLGAMLAGVALVSAMLVASAGPASATTALAKSPKPKIILTASTKSVTTSAGTVTLSATVTNANSATLTSNPPVTALPFNVCCNSSISRQVVLPLNTGKKAVKYQFTVTAQGNTVTKTTKIKVSVASGKGRPALSGVKSVVGSEMYGSGDPTYCAVLTNSGGVDCWGDNLFGELGDGSITGPQTCEGGSPCATTPVAVVGVGGSGTLIGVKSVVASDANYNSFCALLSSGDIDCWGDNYLGELGIGSKAGPETCDSGLYPCSDSPVQALSGASSLTSGGDSSYCAVLDSGGVDCWGYGATGQLGAGDPNVMNGPDLSTCAYGGLCSSVPLGVADLSGVASVVSSHFADNYCAVLDSGGVDCWGSTNGVGSLGDGSHVDSSDCGSSNECSWVPVSVVGVGGSGNLTGVSSVVGGGAGVAYCAVMGSRGVDCWGDNYYGELGAGAISGAPSCQSGTCSSTPVQVIGIGGSGNLSDVSSIDGNGYSPGFCTLVSASGVDCWGDGDFGDLGDGSTSNSDVPEAVLATDGSSSLTGVATLATDGTGFCASLTSSTPSGQVNCWGDDGDGEDANGPNSICASCSIPVAVVGLGDSGDLSGVASLGATYEGYCAVLSSNGSVDCWGLGFVGELGNGTDNYETGSTFPVSVFAVAP